MGEAISNDFEIAPFHEQERKRLRALQKLKILDSEPNERFDRITNLASKTLGFPIVLMSLVDENRQWFKSVCGLDARETSRDYAFCAHAINEDSGVLKIPDTLADARFRTNPLVASAPHIRAYLGIVIRNYDGLPLGTLCAIDTKPRDFTEEEVNMMKAYASLIESEL